MDGDEKIETKDVKVIILGENGVGKSTTMKSIMRLIPINKGEILVDGEKITQKNINKIAYVPDIPIHDLGWTVPQNLEFAKVFYPDFDMDKAKRMIQFFKIPTDKKIFWRNNEKSIADSKSGCRQNDSS